MQADAPSTPATKKYWASAGRRGPISWIAQRGSPATPARPGSTVRQRGGYDVSAVPQFVQNFEPAAFSVPHFGQVIVAAAV